MIYQWIDNSRDWFNDITSQRLSNDLADASLTLRNICAMTEMIIIRSDWLFAVSHQIVTHRELQPAKKK